MIKLIEEIERSCLPQGVQSVQGATKLSTLQHRVCKTHLVEFYCVFINTKLFLFSLLNKLNFIRQFLTSAIS